MAARNPQERILGARLAANAKWAKVKDRRAATLPAREAAEERFFHLVDPNNELDPVERAKRAENARREHFTRMHLNSARARRKRAGKQESDPEEAA